MKPLSVEAALATHLKIDEWLDYFSTLTLGEFNTLCNGVVDRLPDAFREFEFQWVASLGYSLASKMLDFGHFQPGLSEERRAKAIDAAVALSRLIISLLEDFPEKQTALVKAWEIDNERCNLFGYRSGAVYEVLAPHQIFREEQSDRPGAASVP
jgi:hypothetical protein